MFYPSTKIAKKGHSFVQRLKIFFNIFSIKRFDVVLLFLKLQNKIKLNSTRLVH